VSQHTEAVRIPLAAPDAGILISAQHNVPSGIAAITRTMAREPFPTSIEDRRSSSSQRKAPPILVAMRAAGRSLRAPSKREIRMGVLCAMLTAVAAFGGVQQAHASTVTITIKGTVASGEDYSGVFGFAANTDIGGQNFKLVFTFDDTKGQQFGSASCETRITSTTTSNPGTAVLQIGNGSWGFFGSLPNAVPSSAAQLTGGCGNKSGSILLNIQTSDLATPGAGLGSGDSLNADINAVGTTFVADDSWEYSFSDLQLSPSDIAFSIASKSTPSSSLQFANGTLGATSITVSGPQSGPPSTGLQFVPVTPCRVADTRNATGPFGGPELAAGASREFDIPQSACSIPSSAVAYSLNLTAVPSGPLGYLTMWPSGQTQPTGSTLNSDGRVKANAAITPAGTNGGVSVFVTNPSHVILDINGYFVPAGTASALAFYPVTPCRVADTRNATGPFGGPSLAAATSRDFSLHSSSCALPSDAEALSLNVTAVPKGDLGFLTMWPSGQTQPLASTLNSPTGAVTANAAIVPAGSNGDVSVYVSNASDVIIDVNGYFAAPAANGLSLYSTAPCRVIDTRNGSGAFNGTFAVDVESSTCAPSPTAQAYVLNATVVPTGSLGFLTLWPAGQTQPVVSTLNASDGVVTSNMAVVPTMNGSIDALSSSATQLILDLSSYFAP
jgi:hypothetical protein